MESSTDELLSRREKLSQPDILQPLDPKHRPIGICQGCRYRKEHHGVCPNCGQPKDQGKRSL